MVVHFSAICDRSGDIILVISAQPVHNKARTLTDLIKGDVTGILEKARSEGAVFGIERVLAHNGAPCRLAGVHDRDHVLMICADSSKEITDYYGLLKGMDSSSLDDGSFDQSIYDQISRLNNELINAQRDLAKINSKYSRSIERLGLTLARIGSGIIVINGDDRIEFINEAAKGILSNDNDVVGRAWEEIYRVTSEDDPPSNDGLNVEPTVPARKVLRTCDDRELYIIDSINPLGDDGKVIAFQDITPLEELQDNLWRSNEVLRLMTKVLRHDILNNLTVINGYIEIADPDSESEPLNKSRTAALKAEQIIRQMKEMEKMVMSKEELQPYILSDAVAKVMEGQPVDWTIDGDSAVMADPAVYSVLENLVSNAIRHGGTDRIDFEISGDGSDVWLKVSDQGAGVPDSIKNRLFQEGFHHGRSGNTGLGLYLARMVILRYGGEISVEDNEPRGAIFILRFRAAGQADP